MPVEDIVEEVSNVTMFQRAVRAMNIDQDKLPVSGLKREAIVEASEILNQISSTV